MKEKLKRLFKGKTLVGSKKQSEDLEEIKKDMVAAANQANTSPAGMSVPTIRQKKGLNKLFQAANKATDVPKTNRSKANKKTITTPVPRQMERID